MNEAQQLIEKLQLAPLPREGGFFSRVFESRERLPCDNNSCTSAIYYLLRGVDRSNWHKLSSEELWLFHSGAPALQLIIQPDGTLIKRVLGANVLHGEHPQSLIPANAWQTTICLERDSEAYSLFSTVVVPGYLDKQFTPSDDDTILKCFPDHAEDVKAFLSFIDPDSVEFSGPFSFKPGSLRV